MECEYGLEGIVCKRRAAPYRSGRSRAWGQELRVVRVIRLPGGDVSRGAVMRRQFDLFDRAADCERLMNASSSETRKMRFRELRDLWITLANESAAMSKRALLKEIAVIEKIQSLLESKNMIH
jgi:hypothetical protein